MGEQQRHDVDRAHSRQGTKDKQQKKKMNARSSSSSFELQTALAEALVARGIPNGEQIAASLDDLAGCMATVQCWDDRTARKTPGLLVHMLQEGQARDYVSPPKPPVLRSSAERFLDAVAELRGEGFADRELQLAASARMTRGPSTTAALREHLKATYPWLYE
jgi:hypothetical protein